MKNPFKDPIRPTERTNGVKEWSFKAPRYDQRTSCSIPAGDDYGVGFTNPVGKFEARPLSSGVIPQDAMCFSPDDVV
jgi:hypothetical protein